MAAQRTAIGSKGAALMVVIVIIVAAVGFASFLSRPNPPISASQSTQLTRSTQLSIQQNTTSVSTYCSISGQPGAFYVRVLSDSTFSPLVGAEVVAKNEPAYCGDQPATSRTIESFTTNGTAWVELPIEDNAGYTISVFFLGRTYNLTADLRPVSITCATIYLPSGATNITITEFGEACSTTAPSKTLQSISNVAVANVTISGYPGEIAVDANTSRIYVSDLFANKLTVVDASTHTVVGTITLPGTAQSGAAVDPNTDMVYVPVSGCTNEVNASNSCDSSGGAALRGGIVVIDGRSDAIAGEIPIEVDRLAIDAGTGILYGASGNLNFGSNSSGYLMAIDGHSGSLVANTSLGAYPLSVAVDEKTNTVYVGACRQIPLPCVGAEVLAINGTTHAVQSVVPLDFDALNFNVVVDQATNTIYAMGESGSNLTLVSADGASGAIRYSSAIGSSCAGGGGGTLALNTASDQVYAAFNSQWFLLFIDGSAGRITNMLNATGGIQYAAFNPSTDQAYVTMGAQHENVGYLLILPGTTSQGYVDTSLLPRGICLP